jgi:hypothetical protein
MARIKGVSPPGRAICEDRLPLTRRHIAKLTGRQTERMIEPLQMYALVPCSSRATPSSNKRQPGCTGWTEGSTPSPS